MGVQINLGDKPQATVRLEVKVPKKTQQLLTKRIKEIAIRHKVECGFSLHFEMSGELSRTDMEALALEIKHLGRTCGAKITMQTAHQEPGQVEKRVETKTLT